MTTELTRAKEAAEASLLAFDRAGTDTVLQTVPGLAQNLRELLDALCTPTADDVREAVDHAVRAALSPLGIDYVPWWKVVHAVRDSLLAEPTLEVRPRGTVTEGERYAVALRAIANGDGPEFVREFARDALASRSDDACPEWSCPDLSSEDRREGRTCPNHPCTCSETPRGTVAGIADARAENRHSSYCTDGSHPHGRACAVDCPSCAGGWNTLWRIREGVRS